MARWHVEGDAFDRALAVVVDAQAALPMAAFWGTGRTASSDGQFFPAGGRGEALNPPDPPRCKELRSLRLAGRGEKIHEKVCRCGGRVPIREVCRARSTTATTRADLGVSGTLGTCGASNASNETRRS